jgi:hypothetical protein
MSETNWDEPEAQFKQRMAQQGAAGQQHTAYVDQSALNRRASALEAALRFCGGGGAYSKEEVVETAQAFEAFLNGTVVGQ